MTLPDWQIASIIISIIGSVVGATAWISWKMSKAETEINNLKNNLKKCEDDITYMFRLNLEESRVAAEKFRNRLYSGKIVKNTSEDEQD